MECSNFATNPHKFKVNDLIEDKTEDSFGSRPDTVYSITANGYVLQDNYCGMLFELSHEETHAKYLKLPINNFRKQNKANSNNFKIILISFALILIVCSFFIK